MANEVLIKVGAQHRFCVTASVNPTAAVNFTVGTPTDWAHTLSGLATTISRFSAKADLGALRAREYSVFSTIDFSSTPTAGATIDYYWVPSPVSTAGSGNIGGGNGTDDTFANQAFNQSGITIAEFLVYVAPWFIGRMVCDDVTSPQGRYIGQLIPPARYGQLMIINNTSQSFEASNAEHHTVFSPVIDEIQ